MEDCIFCKIVKGEVPSTKAYEDDRFLAFLDIQPVSNGHLLVIPKQHIVWMQDADNDTISGIFILVKRLMSAVKKATGCDYVLISIVGKDVPHFHIHLIPRFLNDGLPHFETKKYKDGEMKMVAEKITRAL